MGEGVGQIPTQGRATGVVREKLRVSLKPSHLTNVRCCLYTEQNKKWSLLLQRVHTSALMVTLHSVEILQASIQAARLLRDILQASIQAARILVDIMLLIWEVHVIIRVKRKIIVRIVE